MPDPGAMHSIMTRL